MNIKLKVFAALIVIGLLCAGLVVAQTPSGPAGITNIAHAYLVEKNPVTWEPVPGGAWGKLVFTLSGPAFAFVFDGHRLDAGVAYRLIYFPDPWPGTGAMCLGDGVAAADGNIRIKGTRNTGTLPIASDLNANPETTTEPPRTGAKIWLVLRSDVSCTGNGMLAYNPTEYLFERELINYKKTELHP